MLAVKNLMRYVPVVSIRIHMHVQVYANMHNLIQNQMVKALMHQHACLYSSCRVAPDGPDEADVVRGGPAHVLHRRDGRAQQAAGGAVGAVRGQAHHHSIVKSCTTVQTVL